MWLLKKNWPAAGACIGCPEYEMLSWKIPFVKPSGSLIFLSALSGPQNTSARGRLLLILFSGEIYFSNGAAHRAKGKAS